MDWLIAEAYYGHIVGESATLCQVIAVVSGGGSQVSLVKKVPFQKTDADKNTVTTWSLVDLRDAEGNGRLNIVLEGDSYEDHWIEVDRIEETTIKTIFSGLGYYL